MNITEQEILNHPNDSELGKYIRMKFNNQNEIDNEFDSCVLCGKKSPYKKTFHIDHRIGYVEGAGQGCFQPNMCNSPQPKYLI